MTDEQTDEQTDEPADEPAEEAAREQPDGPTVVLEPVLTASERRRTWLAGVTPVVVVTTALAVAAVAGEATLGDIVVGAVLYGGLLGLTAAVVSHERAQAAHCPACDASGQVGRPVCAACGYDLAARPLYRCEQRHDRYVEPGLCRCGRRLQRIEPIRGLDREIKRTLWAGAWLAAFLLGVVLLLPLVD